MALYKYGDFLEQSPHKAFDEIHTPGTEVPYSGIYRCVGCGKNVAANQGDPLPTQNHHQHQPSQGKIRWQLIVATE